MNEQNGFKKDIIMFDIWVLASMLFFGMPGYMSLVTLFIPSSSNTVISEVHATSNLAMYAMTFIILLAVIFLIFCSKLKKWRYLIIYLSCKKIPDTYKILLFILCLLGGLYLLVTSSFLFLFIAVFAIISTGVSSYWNEKTVDGLIAE